MEPGKMTIGQLLQQMKPAHLWSVLVGISALVAAAGAAGYTAQTMVHEGMINSMQLRIDKLQQSLSSPSAADAANETTSGAATVQYPTVADRRSPTEAEVADLADFYGLTSKWGRTPILRLGRVNYRIGTGRG